MGRAISGKVAALALLAAISFISVSSALVAAEPPRITSMNVCTDQLLLTLAGEQILGLSRYARDAEQSENRAKHQPRWKLAQHHLPPIAQLDLAERQ